MKKLIGILTLCMFTSFAVATPIAAANVTTCTNNNAKNVNISCNVKGITNISDIAKCLNAGQLLKNCTKTNSDTAGVNESADNTSCKNSCTTNACATNTCPTNVCTTNTCNSNVLNSNCNPCTKVAGSNCAKVTDTTCPLVNNKAAQVKSANTVTPNNIKSVKVVKKNCKKAKKAKKAATNKTTVTQSNNATTNTTTKDTTANNNTKNTTTKNTTASTTTSATKNNTSTTNTSVTSTGTYTEFQKKVVELVNKERAAAGLSPLSEKTELDKVATLKSEDMVKMNYFSHTSPTYGSPFEMLTQFGIGYSAAGENIAYGQATPEEVMNGWMNSPGHRANILNANFTQIGVGIAKKSNGQLVWTQTFTRP